MKKYLFVMRHAPHSGSAIQEIVDVILTTAAFDQQVVVVLMDEAVFALKTQQQPEKYGLKDTAAIFNALPLYEVSPLYVEAESLQQYGLTVAELNLPVELVPRSQIAVLLKKADVIWTC